jgi:catechol 2,3-dioxygenase-like lactoylglutathione lyase family enzyme
VGLERSTKEVVVPVQRLNHAVLYVRDVEASVAFYREALGFRVRAEIPGRAVFLQAEGSTNDHDLGLFAVGAQAAESTAGRGSVGLYHLAW